jgi:hypothetical protein
VASLQAQIASLQATLAFPDCADGEFLQFTASGLWQCASPVHAGTAGQFCRAASDPGDAPVMCDVGAPQVEKPPDCQPPGAKFLTYSAQSGWVCVCAAGYTGASCNVSAGGGASGVESCNPPAACASPGSTGLYQWLPNDDRWVCHCQSGYSGDDCSVAPPVVLCDTADKGGTDDPVQCAALVALGVSANLPGWMTGQSYCSWTGITCDGPDVVGLSPTGCYAGGALCVPGQIPSSFGSLTALRSLSLEGDNFAGALPSSFSSLRNLTSLFLHSWSLNGTLDVLSSLPALTSLTMLNSAITGSLPTPPALESLDIFNIAFSGAIPAAYGTLPNLARIRLDYMHGLSGALPTFGSTLTSLYVSCISQCSFEGSLSAAIASCTNLQSLFITGTTLSGTLQESACPVLNGLSSCTLTGNQLGCPLPSCMTSLQCNPSQCA